MDQTALIRFFEEGIPFNQHLGMKVLAMDGLKEAADHRSFGSCRVLIPYKPALVGDPFRPALHGGVLSTLADTAGGLAVFAAVGTLEARVSTVDLRVDYYEPAALEELVAEADVVRLGNRVGVARIRLLQGSRLVGEGKGVYNVKRPQERG
jgi:uncharacterized protein (TIGR00369 family)